MHFQTVGAEYPGGGSEYPGVVRRNNRQDPSLPFGLDVLPTSIVGYFNVYHLKLVLIKYY